VIPWRPLIDPGAQESDLFRGERFAFTFRRHLQVRHHPRHVMQERALRAVARYDTHSIVATGQRVRPGIQTEAAPGHFGSVTFHAGRNEQRLDLAGEIHRVGRGGWQRGGIQWCGVRRQHENDSQGEPSRGRGQEGAARRVGAVHSFHRFKVFPSFGVLLRHSRQDSMGTGTRCKSHSLPEGRFPVRNGARVW
jgi:hypothetical protein